MKNPFRKKQKEEIIKLDINDLIEDGYCEIKDISVLEIKEYYEYSTYCYFYRHKDKKIYFEPYGYCGDDYIFYNEELKLYIVDNYEYFSKKQKEEYKLIRKKLLKNE